MQDRAICKKDRDKVDGSGRRPRHSSTKHPALATPANDMSAEKPLEAVQIPRSGHGCPPFASLRNFHRL